MQNILGSRESVVPAHQKQCFKGRDAMLKKKKPIFFLRELYFIRLTLDNWIAKNDSSFVDVCIHGYVCVCARACILDLGVLPQENVRIRWDYKDTLSLLDYKVVLLLSD